MNLDLVSMDFDFFELAHNDCFPVLNIALNNLDVYNFDVNSQDETGNTLLHYSAAAGKFKHLLLL